MSGINTLTAIGNGLSANDGTGDALRSGADKINGNNAAIVTAVNNLAASQSAGMISYLLKSDMDADLAHADGVLATVTNDPTDANNGGYRKSGASGSGSWAVTIDRATIIKNDLASSSAGKGASLVGFLQSGTGAVGQDELTHGREQPATPEQFGAVGDGVTDDTVALQKWLNRGGSLQLNGKTYITGPLTVLANTKIQFHPSTILKAKTGYGANDSLLNISVDNVTVYGSGAIIQMIKSEYTTGEQRHCVNAINCSNVRIYDLTAKDSGGDGFYVMGNNVSLINCIADNNRRNGLSITAGSNIFIYGGEYKNSIGTNPQAGIDIEPNAGAAALENINLIGVKTSGNFAFGISIVPYNATTPVTINVLNCTSINDQTGLTLSLSPPVKILGKITVDNMTIVTPGSNGVAMLNWTENNPFLSLRNVRVINPGASVSASNSLNCGFNASSNADFGVTMGNFELINFQAKDTRATPFMRIPVFIQTQYMPLKNITIIDPDTSGQTAGFSTDVVFGAAFTSSLVKVQYRQEFAVAQTSTLGVNRSMSGATITNTGQASHTANLPDANSNLGMIISARVTQAGFIRLAPAGTDTILRYGSDPGISILARSPGDFITLQSIGSGQWQVLSATGQWMSFIGALNTSAKRVYNGLSTTAPTTGTWAVGDVVGNSAPASAGFIGWVCTVAGTPGTWKTFGLIS